MNPSKLKESETVEFKESFKDDALKTLSAFANTSGGSLFIGVKDDNTLLGLKITDKVQQRIINQIEDVLGLQPAVIVHKGDSGEFLEVKVTKSNKPVDVRGRFYKRVGNTTREIDRDGLKSLLLRDVSWDSQLRDDVTFDDLAHNLTFSISVLAYENIYGKPPEEFNDEEFLEHLGLIKDDSITNAALLLFGSNKSPKFPFAKIRIGRFKGESTIISDHTIGGNLINQLQESERIIKTLLHKRYNITGKSFKREEVWEYPLEAIREAILNALVHRSYHITNAHIEIKIYDDQILFYSPGTLPEGITIDQLSKAHPSIRRNPLLAETFFRAGYIEQFGSGTLRMRESLKAAGHPEPEFREEGNGFLVRFEAPTETMQIDESDLNDRQVKILDIARQKDSFKMSDITEVIDSVDERTLRRDINDLMEAGMLHAEGEKRGRVYFLK